MTGRWRALLRLYAVQGAWNYERMLGVGMGYAAEPLLADLAAADPVRHSEAVVRSAEFFNCNPNLAGLALGATVRAEYLGVPGDQVARLRTALCSPLGALGDQLFWAGVVPALIGATIVGAVVGLKLAAVVTFLIVYNLFRLTVGGWSLSTGLASGAAVGHAIASSWLPRWSARIGAYAAFSIGVAAPVAAGWFLHGYAWRGTAGALGVALTGILLGRLWGRTFTAVRFALVAMGTALLLRWVIGFL